MRVVICSIGAVSDFAGAGILSATGGAWEDAGVDKMPSASLAGSGMRGKVAGFERAGK